VGQVRAFEVAPQSGPPEAATETLDAGLLPRDPKQVLGRAGITLDRAEALRLELATEHEAARGEHPHRSERDGKEADP